MAVKRGYAGMVAMNMGFPNVVGIFWGPHNQDHSIGVYTGLPPFRETTKSS